MTVISRDGSQSTDHDVNFIDDACRADFISFLMLAYPHISGGGDLAMNWHLEAIGHQLGRVARGLSHRLIVNLPPRNLKSITVSVAWVAWMLGNSPALNFVCISYSNELSAKHARDCRAIMKSAWYRRIFPRTLISASRSALHDFETTAGGGRLATSISGTLTGRGGDIIIVDDPIKPDEAVSNTVRNRVNDWFSSTLATRLDDKDSGAILLVMQRLHQYDLSGMLIEAGGWDLLALPAIATEDVIVPLTSGRFYHRCEGDVLHPEREGRRSLDASRLTMGSAHFSAQFQQQPVPAEGNMIKAEWLCSYAYLPGDHTGQIVQSWDTASKEGLFTDWSVCVTARIIGRRVHIIDVWRRKVEFPALRRAATELATRFAADVILIEDQASGTQLIQSLRNDTPAGVAWPTARRPEGDKESRVAGVTAMMERGQLLLPPDASWLAEFKRELLGFPSLPKDDQVDALSQLLTWADRQYRTFGQCTEASAPIVFTAEDDYNPGYVGDEYDEVADLPPPYRNGWEAALAAIDPWLS